MTKRKAKADDVRKAKIKKQNGASLEAVRSNPFEIKINKQKHNILGRKSKNDKGLPGVSRSNSNKKRQKTLLQELRRQHKTSAISDKRLGAGDTDTSLEEKMLQRFSMERKKKHEKNSQFSLNDEEELTHLGQSLSDIKNFDDFGDSDDDDDDGRGGAIPGEYVSNKHFGGGVFTKKESDDKSEPQSRKYVIDEIIAKSKQSKYEKQQTKERSEEIREKLDSNWKELESLLNRFVRTPKDKEEARAQQKPDDFDVAVKQMQFDKKVAPAERCKSEEEKKREEEEKMKRMEEERIARMQGGGGEQERRRKKYQSADALDDDGLVYGMGNNADAKVLSFPMTGDDDDEKDGSDDDGDEDEEQEESDDEEAEEVSGSNEGDLGIGPEEEESGSSDPDSDNYSDIDSGNEDDLVSDLSEEVQAASSSQDSSAPLDDSALPPTKFPSSYADFARLVNTTATSSRDGDVTSAARQVVDRLRKLYAPQAAKGNKARMVELFAFVWQHCHQMAAQRPPRINVISSLCRSMYELCAMNPESCSDCVRERLKQSHHASFKQKSVHWPSFAEMLQFKLIKNIFPTSDFSHPVSTPALIFLAQLLNRCKVADLRDLASGLFLCTLCYEYVVFSKRLVPECVNFLSTVLYMRMPAHLLANSEVNPAASRHLNRANCALLVPTSDVTSPDDDVMQPDLVEAICGDVTGDAAADRLKRQLFNVTLNLIDNFARLHSALPSRVELFAPVERACHVIGSAIDDDDVIASRVTALAAALRESRDTRKLERVTSGKPKPKLLTLFTPKVEDVGDMFQKRSKKTNQQKKERERLLHKRKKETKGAIREIRKDSKFIASERLREQEELDRERAAKVKRLMGLLSNQEGEVKNIKRQKYKLDL